MYYINIRYMVYVNKVSEKETLFSLFFRKLRVFVQQNQNNFLEQLLPIRYSFFYVWPRWLSIMLQQKNNF